MIVASAYNTIKKGYLIFGTAKTMSGFRVGVEPYFLISENNASDDTISDAIRISLNNSDTKRVPDPKNWKEDDKIFCKKQD